MAEGGRDRPAVLIAMLLLAIGLFLGAVAVAWAIHQHRADEAARRNDPSFRYGNNLPIFGPAFQGSSPRSSCARYLGAHPASFDGFSLRKAIDGCVDEWNAATE